MRAFSKLYQHLEISKSKIAKIDALEEYYTSVSPQDCLWAIALFLQKRPKRMLSTLEMRMLAAETANIPDWLYDECLRISNDQSETNALLIKETYISETRSLSEIIEELEELRKNEKSTINKAIVELWQLMDNNERILFNKIVSGTFRKNISPGIIAKSLSNFLGENESTFLHRLNDNWSPYDTTFERLFLKSHYKDQISMPYPLCYGHTLDQPISSLANCKDWLAEWKFYGLRAQFIWREGEYFLYSKENELISDRFPELKQVTNDINYDFVIDGDIIPFRNGKVLNYETLAKRIKKKKPSLNTIKNLPIIFSAYDIIEYRAEDVREEPLQQRKELLDTLNRDANSQLLEVAKVLDFNDWHDVEKLLANSRDHKAVGIVLKKKNSSYRGGRYEGDWWKLKTSLMSIKAVLTYAHRSPERGNRSFVDFTFGLWHDEELITFVKTAEGLSKQDHEELLNFVKNNTIERFGPVYSVKAEQVFEIGFEGIQESKRHKSGILLRRPKIINWCKETNPEEANYLSEIKELL